MALPRLGAGTDRGERVSLGADRSAVPADPEDDVLPGRDAGPRVLVLAVLPCRGRARRCRARPPRRAAPRPSARPGRRSRRARRGPARRRGAWRSDGRTSGVTVSWTRSSWARPGVAHDRHRTRGARRGSGHARGDVGDDADQAGALGEVQGGGVGRRDRARRDVEGPARRARLLARPARAGDLPGAVVGAVGVPRDGVDVGVDQPQPVGHELVQGHGGVPSVSRTRASRACSATRARSWMHRVGEPHDPLDPGAGGGGDLLRGLAGPDAGLDHPRGELGAEVDVDLGQAAGVPACRGAQPVVDRQLEPLAAVGGVRRPRPPGSGSSRRRRAPRGAACAWRTSCRLRGPGRREIGPEPEAIGAPGARPAGHPAWRVPAPAARSPAREVRSAPFPADEVHGHVLAPGDRHSGHLGVAAGEAEQRRCDGQPTDRPMVRDVERRAPSAGRAGVAAGRRARCGRRDRRLVRSLAVSRPLFADYPAAPADEAVDPEGRLRDGYAVLGARLESLGASGLAAAAAAMAAERRDPRGDRRRPGPTAGRPCSPTRSTPCPGSCRAAAVGPGRGRRRAAAPRAQRLPRRRLPGGRPPAG